MEESRKREPLDVTKLSASDVETINVMEVNDSVDHIVTLHEGRYRCVLPVELCAHEEHATSLEAIQCGSPRAIVLSTIIRSIGEEMLNKLDKEERDAAADAPADTDA